MLRKKLAAVAEEKSRLEKEALAKAVAATEVVMEQQSYLRRRYKMESNLLFKMPEHTFHKRIAPICPPLV